MDDANGNNGKDADVRCCRPNLFEVRGSREEIFLFFGQIEDAREDQAPLSVTCDRIILNPMVAKRLATSLEKCISAYETRYGPLAGTTPAANEGDHTQNRRRKGLKRANDADVLLCERVSALGVDTATEHSFKMHPETLLANRFLLGIAKHSLGENAHEKITAICTDMGMPSDLLASFRDRLSDANYVHFGFENNGGSSILKAYLEFYDEIESNLKDGGTPKQGTWVLYRGYKWDPEDRARCFETVYDWHPWLSVGDMAERIARILGTSRDSKTLEITRAILRLASRRVADQEMLYLEVTEKGNPRKSFDVNLYRAGMQLSELYPYLYELCRCYSIRLDPFHELYHSAKKQIFGHLSGGTDRNNREFLTIYHGPRGPRDQAAPTIRSGPIAAGKNSGRIAPLTAAHRTYTGAETHNEKAGLLYDLVNGLGVTVGVERSFKVLEGTLLKDRFLMGFRSGGIGHDDHGRILNICRRLNMPRDFMENFQTHLPSATIVLFGFEAGEKATIYKAYLEFGGRYREALGENPNHPDPFPIHTAFKWDPADRSLKSTADYICFPALTIPDILERVSAAFYPRGSGGTAYGIIDKAMDLVAARSGHDGCLYFETQEPHNRRVSFDINVYLAGLRIQELYPLLVDMARHYSIPDEPFHDLYATIRPLIFGHLSGGTDRQGRDFLTVYFGEKGSSGFGAET